MRQTSALIERARFRSAKGSLCFELVTSSWTRVRIDIDIDDALLAEVLARTGIRDPQDAVAQGLRALLRQTTQREALKHFGKIPWEGDLDEMRRD